MENQIKSDPVAVKPDLPGESEIKRTLESAFSYLSGKVVVIRARRVSADVPLDKFMDVFDYMVKKMGFGVISAITGMDKGDVFGVIYHVNKDGMTVNLKIDVPKARPVIPTVLNYFAYAEIYERELIDLLGIQVKDMPKGHRYPLPDNWPEGEYPLRKEWKPKDNLPIMEDSEK